MCILTPQNVKSCTCIHTLIVLTTTYMIIVFLCLYIHEGKDTKIIMCTSKRCNCGHHPCCLRLGIHKDLWGGDIVSFIFLHIKSKKVRHNWQKTLWFTTIPKNLKPLKSTNLLTQSWFPWNFLNWLFLIFCNHVQGLQAANQRRWCWIMQRG